MMKSLLLCLKGIAIGGKRADALGNLLGYFNAGFLVLNLVNWSKFDISTKAMDLLSQDAVKKIILFRPRHFKYAINRESHLP